MGRLLCSEAREAFRDRGLTCDNTSGGDTLRSALFCDRSPTGSSRRNVVPAPGLDVNWILPPWTLATCCASCTDYQAFVDEDVRLLGLAPAPGRGANK